MRTLVVLTAAAVTALAGGIPKDKRVEHALNRLTFGPRPGEIERVRKMGLEKWIDLQLHPERIAENPALEAKLRRLETLGMTAAEMVRAYPPPQVLRAISNGRMPYPADPERRRTVEELVSRMKNGEPVNQPQQLVVRELATAKLYRAVLSERQLYEVLADFWFNHFNVFLDKGADRYLVTSYERDAIRPHVLGRFSDLLRATAEHPAMLFYLDNWQSTDPTRGRGLNENYARELLELHSLGVDGGYTQRDVVEVARCFTGWTIRAPQLGGGFYFNQRMHDDGEKTVLGEKIPAGGGVNDGLRVLELVARHPSTARHISRRLAQRFVADEPPQSLVERMAKTFLKTDGDLRAVVKAMLGAKEFWQERAYRAKVKSPLELVASAVRALDAQVNSAAALAGVLGRMGQPLYRKQEPTGYSNSGEDWVNSASLVARMNFALALASNRLPGVGVAERPADGGVALGSPEFQRR